MFTVFRRLLSLSTFMNESKPSRRATHGTNLCRYDLEAAESDAIHAQMRYVEAEDLAERLREEMKWCEMEMCYDETDEDLSF
jgi:hypothetical protein